MTSHACSDFTPRVEIADFTPVAWCDRCRSPIRPDERWAMSVMQHGPESVEVTGCTHAGTCPTPLRALRAADAVYAAIARMMRARPGVAWPKAVAVAPDVARALNALPRDDEKIRRTANIAEALAATPFNRPGFVDIVEERNLPPGAIVPLNSTLFFSLPLRP